MTKHFSFQIYRSCCFTSKTLVWLKLTLYISNKYKKGIFKVKHQCMTKHTSVRLNNSDVHQANTECFQSQPLE